MANPVILIAGIVILAVILLVTICALIWYSGFFDGITVGAGEPPCANLKVVYKFGRGPYKDVGGVFTEVTCLAPKLRCFGIYYDDPKQVASTKLRWAVGCVLAEGQEKPDPALVAAFQKEDFKEFHFPKVNNAVKTSFPYRSQLSVLMGVFRVYPELAGYIRSMKLCAHPFVELYSGSTIEYFAPLSKQEGFYVPECDPDFVSPASTSTDKKDTSETKPASDSSLGEGTSKSKTTKVDSVDKDNLPNKDLVSVGKKDILSSSPGTDNETSREQSTQRVPDVNDELVRKKSSEDQSVQSVPQGKGSVPDGKASCSVDRTIKKESSKLQKHHSEPPQRLPQQLNPGVELPSKNLLECKVNSTTGSTSSLDIHNPDTESENIQCSGVTSTTRSASQSDYSNAMTPRSDSFSDDDIPSFTTGSFVDSKVSYMTDDSYSCVSLGASSAHTSDILEEETTQTPVPDQEGGGSGLVELSSDSDGEANVTDDQPCPEVSPDKQRHS